MGYTSLFGVVICFLLPYTLLYYKVGRRFLKIIVKKGGFLMKVDWRHGFAVVVLVLMLYGLSILTNPEFQECYKYQPVWQEAQECIDEGLKYDVICKPRWGDVNFTHTEGVTE